MSAVNHDAPLWRLSLIEAGARFRRGELSPVELTTAILERIAHTEPAIHAYVEVYADDALAAARQAEAELRAGHDRGPLQGIPIGVKDIFDMGGQPTRCGARARANAAPATGDAEVVTRLHASGAVLIGKTVTQEFAAGVVSAPARNPWDPRRIPGGSSGGSGAAVAAGSCLTALGTDTGGSIRIPSAVNGITGLKPTFGRISTAGVFPYSSSLDTVGPLARSVADVQAMYQVLAGIADEPAAVPAQSGGLRGVRLGVPRPYFFDRLQAGVGAAVEAALTALENLGAELVEVDWIEAKSARAVAHLLSRAEGAMVHLDALRSAAAELYSPELLTSFAAGALIPAAGYLRAQQARLVVKRSMADLFATHEIESLVLPTLPATAVPANDLTVHFDDGDEPVRAAYTRLTQPFNATGQPILALPCGFDAAGLPVSLQLVGRPFAETRLCQLGRAFQAATDWHERRPPL